MPVVAVGQVELQGETVGQGRLPEVTVGQVGVAKGNGRSRWVTSSNSGASRVTRGSTYHPS